MITIIIQNLIINHDLDIFFNFFFFDLLFILFEYKILNKFSQANNNMVVSKSSALKLQKIFNSVTLRDKTFLYIHKLYIQTYSNSYTPLEVRHVHK